MCDRILMFPIVLLRTLQAYIYLSLSSTMYSDFKVVRPDFTDMTNQLITVENSSWVRRLVNQFSSRRSLI